MLQCIAVCCSVLQRVAVYRSPLIAWSIPKATPFAAVYCSVLQYLAVLSNALQCVAVGCSGLQCVAVCCSVLQCVAVCCSVSLIDNFVFDPKRHRLLQCVAVCCSVLQCVAVCCSVSQSLRPSLTLSFFSLSLSSPPPFFLVFSLSLSFSFVLEQR